MNGSQADTILVGILAVLIVIGWYLSYSAARLDRLHAKVEGATSVLDARLVRRAEACLELATSGALDPASSLLLAGAAGAALERQPEHPVGDDPLDGQHFAGRESVESDLTWALSAALTEDVVADLRSGAAAEDDDGYAALLTRVEDCALRVQLARRFLNDAVTEVRRVRGKVVVRAFRLAGHAALPEPVDLDDELPPSLRA